MKSTYHLQLPLGFHVPTRDGQSSQMITRLSFGIQSKDLKYSVNYMLAWIHFSALCFTLNLTRKLLK